MQPELRRFLATWYNEREPPTSAGAMPLFPGNSHGRASESAIRRRLARLDAPASLWEDSPDITVGDGAHADGRALLLRLSAWHLWRSLHRGALVTLDRDGRCVVALDGSACGGSTTHAMAWTLVGDGWQPSRGAKGDGASDRRVWMKRIRIASNARLVSELGTLRLGAPPPPAADPARSSARLPV